MKISFQDIKEYYHKPLGVLFILLIYIIYFSNIDIADFDLKLLLLIIGAVLIVLIWAVTSEYLGLNFSNKVFIILSINNDENNSGDIINTIVKNTTNDICSILDDSNIKLKLIKPNSYKTATRLVKHYSKCSYNLHGIIHLTTISGNIDNNKIIKVENAELFCNLNQNKLLKRIYYDNIHKISDIKLVKSCGKWEYIESHSYKTKQELIISLKSFILFSAGLAAIYEDKFENALKIMKEIPSYDDNERNSGEEQASYNFNQRLAAILFNLYLRVVNDYYDRDNLIEALNLAIECEKRIQKTPYSFNIYILIARISFETGDLINAKLYNEKAKEIHRTNVATIINDAWFCIIENNLEGALKHFQNLKDKNINKYQNSLDIIQFYEKYKSRFPGLENEFNLAIGFYNHCFADKQSGTKTLRDFLQNPVFGRNQFLVNQFCYSLIGKKRIFQNIIPQKKLKRKMA